MYIGIDAGSRNIGVAEFSWAKNEVLGYAELNPKTHLEYFYLLKSRYETFKGHDFEGVVIEKPFFTGINIAKGSDVIEYIGVTKLYFSLYHDVNCDMLSPTRAKKIFTGKGNASKEEIIKTVQENFGIFETSTHINDAIANVVSYLQDKGIYEWKK